MTALRKRMIEEMRIRGYALATQKHYVRYVARFAEHFGRSPDQLGPEHVRKFQLFLLDEAKVSYDTLSQFVLALRFFYRFTLRKNWMIEQIPYPKRPRKLPVVLSREEVLQILDGTFNIKHRAILTIQRSDRPVAESMRIGMVTRDSNQSTGGKQMNVDEVTTEVARTLKRLVNDEDFELPIQCVVLARNGSLLAVRYRPVAEIEAADGQTGLTCDILAESYADNLFILPVNIMFVDATGERAARVVIETPESEPRSWVFGDEPSGN